MTEPVASRKIRMPIRANPYRHQEEAFLFVCEMFGLIDSQIGDVKTCRKGGGQICQKKKLNQKASRF